MEAIARTRSDRLYGPILWLVVVLVAAALAIRMGSALGQPVFNWDGRYLMAAADCLAAGQSPYDVGALFGCWEERTGTPARATYVFPPQSLLPAWPLALFARPAADMVILGWQAVAFAVLAVLSVAFLKEQRLSGWARWTSAGWLALALSNSGVFGTVFLGQLSLASAAGLVAMALAVSGVSMRPWATGLILAMFKPHLTAVAVLGAFLITRSRDAGRKLWAAAALLAANGWIFLVDPGFVGHYREALRVHSESPYSDVGSPERLVGLPGLIAGITPVWALLVLVVAGVSMVVSLGLARRGPVQDRHMAGFVALVVIGAFLVPHKIYDLAIYAVVFLAAARQPLRLQAFLIVPLIVLWRPALLGSLGLDPTTGANLALIALGTSFTALALTARRSPA
jgi:hypothetical protein